MKKSISLFCLAALLLSGCYMMRPESYQMRTAYYQAKNRG